MILAYTAIFLGLAIFTGTYNSTSTDYKSMDVKVAIINRDKNTELINGFKDYIKDHGELISLEDDNESLRDALFYRTVDYIMIIPDNYTTDFINGKDVTIETMELPDAYSSIYSKNLLNKYLNTANLYLKAGISDTELSKLIKEDLNKKVEVGMLDKQNEVDFTMPATYYNFSNYMLITITMVIVTMIMVSFNEEKIKRRNLVSPVSYKSMNRQLMLGNYTVDAAKFLESPREVTIVKPELPEIPQTATVAPDMRVRFLIDKKGNVKNVFVERSSGYAPVDEAVKKAILQWKFTPAIGTDQKAHESIIGMTITLPKQAVKAK